MKYARKGEVIKMYISAAARTRNQYPEPTYRIQKSLEVK